MSSIWEIGLKDLFTKFINYEREVRAIADNFVEIKRRHVQQGPPQKKRKHRKAKDDEILASDENVPMESTQRSNPARVARSVALSQIKQQSQMNLNMKLRRPGSNENLTTSPETSSPKRTLYVVETPPTVVRNKKRSKSLKKKVEKEPETQAEGEPEIQVEEEPESRVEKEPEIEAEKEPETQAKEEPEVQAEKEPEIQNEKELQMQTEVPVRAGTLKNAAAVVIVESSSPKDFVRPFKAKRKVASSMAKLSDFNPPAESSAILSPNGTYLVNPNLEATFVCNKTSGSNGSRNSVARTKPVADSKYFDKEGNPLTSTSKRATNKSIEPRREKSRPSTDIESDSELPETQNCNGTFTLKVNTSKNDIVTENAEVVDGNMRMTRTKTRAMQQQALNTIPESPNDSNNSNTAQKGAKRRISRVIAPKKYLSKLAQEEIRFKTPSSARKLDSARKLLLTKSSGKKDKTCIIHNVPDSQVLAKLKEKEAKEQEAIIKRNLELQKKQNQLKQKNEEKFKKVAEHRKIQDEKRQQEILQMEKEKEEKRQQLLRERELLKKEELALKKVKANKKMAEIEERRRCEEEARLARIKEQELEIKKQEEIKRQQQELEEKRAKERMEEKKKLEEIAKKVQKEQKIIRKEPKFKYDPDKYKARDENDLGLELEKSDDSDDEELEVYDKRPVPAWVEELANADFDHIFNPETKSLFFEYMTIPNATPDIVSMFRMSPERHLPRSSSAVWTATPQ